jgi:hypothetical protein
MAERGDGYHRMPITDALIAAAATEHGGEPSEALVQRLGFEGGREDEEADRLAVGVV